MKPVLAICLAMIIVATNASSQTLTIAARNPRWVQAKDLLFQYEIWLAASEPGHRIGSILIYNNYDTTLFAPNARRILLYKGDSFGSEYERNPLNHNTPSRFAFSWTYQGPAGGGMEVPTHGVLAFTVQIAAINAPGASGVTFEHPLMDKEQYLDDERSVWPNVAYSGFNAGTSYNVLNGWNLVSVPLTVSNYATPSLYPTAISDAFAFDGSYYATSSLVNAQGYWLKFAESQTITQSGFERSFDTVDVNQGWNIIGSITTPVAVSNIGSVPGGIVTSNIFEYGSEGYAVASTVESGKGYWVKVNQNGRLILSSASLTPSQRIRIVPTGELPPAAPSGELLNSVSLIPKEFSLGQNYPNPFNPSTTIRYDLPIDSRVSLKLFNVLGQEVVTLANEEQEAGYRSVEWNAGSVSSGVYFYRLEAGSFTSVKKLLLLK